MVNEVVDQIKEVDGWRPLVLHSNYLDPFSGNLLNVEAFSSALFGPRPTLTLPSICQGSALRRHFYVPFRILRLGGGLLL